MTIKEEMDEGVVNLLNQFFEDSWSKIKKEVKDLSWKEALREMFVSGGMFHKEMNDSVMANVFEMMRKNPKDFDRLANEWEEKIKEDKEEGG